MKNVPILLIGLFLLSTNFLNAQANGTSGSFTDNRDGKTYKTVNIGIKTWMAENLNYNMSDSWCNQCETYGRLYSFKAALNACPSGWHLPSDAEWTNLTTYLGGEGIAGGKLKETGTTHWQSPNTGASNETGFKALPGGYRYGNGTFNGTFSTIGNFGIWWSSTEHDTGSTWSWRMINFVRNVIRGLNTKESGFSVRCVRDK